MVVSGSSGGVFMKRRTNVALCILILVLSSCSSESGNSNKFIELTQTGVQLASCQYGYDEGEPSPKELPAQDYKTTYFGKKYDQSLLYAIASTSGRETVRFAGLTGVNYYRVDLSSMDGCNYTISLDLAPWDLDKDFRLANKRLDGSILGIFYDQERIAMVTKNSLTKPAIVVKNNSDRYTLVHEFMHHLFSKKQKDGELTVAKQLAEKDEAYTKAEAIFDIEPSEENYHHLVVSYYEYVKILIQYMSQYSLEEMTIETELSSLFENGALKYVHELRRTNGDRYILNSSEVAMEMIKSLKLVHQKIRSYNMKYNSAESQVISNQTQSKIDEVESQIYNLNRAAVLRLQKQNRGFVDLQSQQYLLNQEDLYKKDFDCSHSHLEREHLKETIKKLRRYL